MTRRFPSPGRLVCMTATLGLAAGAVAACTTYSNIVDHRGSGETRCYVAAFDHLWPAVETGVRELGLVLERANRENGILVARTYQREDIPPEEMALQSNAGERVAVFLERDSIDGEGRDIWAIEVLSRPIFSLDVTPRDWTRSVFLALENRLSEDVFDPNEDVAACSRVRGGR
ncbi:MAG: hypothetical protein OEU54_15690 [Gemmatimonadota bacterium]|nr:hypothetical protein [Gemmatimonadota bacterium]